MADHPRDHPVDNWREPAKIPLRNRILLYRPEDGRSWRSLARFAARCLTARWAGQGSGSFRRRDGRWEAWSGWCGHKAFTKRSILKHRHPEASTDG